MNLKQRFFSLTAIIVFSVLAASNTEAALKGAEKQKALNKPDDVTKARITKGYGKLPLSFIQNDGQMHKSVKFYEKGKGHTTFFTKEGMSMLLSAPGASSVGDPLGKILSAQSKGEETNPAQFSKKQNPSEFVRLIPLGANQNPEIVAEGKQEGVVNYFIGNDPKKWRTAIPAYDAVFYKDVYENIDMRFYGNNRQFEYDVIVKPGADP